eukprot:215379-Prorocentrum_lima.AAC.1
MLRHRLLGPFDTAVQAELWLRKRRGAFRLCRQLVDGIRKKGGKLTRAKIQERLRRLQNAPRSSGRPKRPEWLRVSPRSVL